jgi:hypothetical protein
MSRLPVTFEQREDGLHRAINHFYFVLGFLAGIGTAIIVAIIWFLL